MLASAEGGGRENLAYYIQNQVTSKNERTDKTVDDMGVHLDFGVVEEYNCGTCFSTIFDLENQF